MKLNLDILEHRNVELLQKRDGEGIIRITRNYYSDLYTYKVTDAESGHVNCTSAGRVAVITETGRDIIFKPDAVVPFGNNPARVTFEQLGEEYRLLDIDEINERGKQGIEVWINGEWYGGMHGMLESWTYRTKLTREELAQLDAQTEQVKESSTTNNMIDTNKPMANKLYGKVTDWFMKPEWVDFGLPLICKFEDGEVQEFTKDGLFYQGGRDPDYDLYNIEEKPYWSKSKDVPLNLLAMRLKMYDGSVSLNRAYVTEVHGTGIIVCSSTIIEWEKLKDWEWTDGNEWKECRCE